MSEHTGCSLVTLECRFTPPLEPSAAAEFVAKIWVYERDLTLARQYAVAAVVERGFQITRLTGVTAVLTTDVARYRTEERERFLVARDYGLGAMFIGFPDGELPPPEDMAGGAAEVRALRREPTAEEKARYWSRICAKQARSSAPRCLHPHAGAGVCGRPIRAHSIQRGGVLRDIARDGHVVRISADPGTLERTHGHFAAELIGITKASTFSGFCDRHDDDVFAPIEKQPFAGTLQQCFLYVYRPLVRELCLKMAASEHASLLLDAAAEKHSPPERAALRDTVEAYRTGLAQGVRTVQAHKALFDQMLTTGDFAPLRYVLLAFRQVPTIAIATGWHPTSDFEGRRFENILRLGRADALPDLLTMSSVHAPHGGGLLLAWHASSDFTCEPFVESLLRIGKERLCDALVRLAFSCSENVFASPAWWEELAEPDRAALIQRLERICDFTVAVGEDGLPDDGRALANWEPLSAAVRFTQGTDHPHSILTY